MGSFPHSLIVTLFGVFWDHQTSFLLYSGFGKSGCSAATDHILAELLKGSSE